MQKGWPVTFGVHTVSYGPIRARVLHVCQPYNKDVYIMRACVFMLTWSKIKFDQKHGGFSNLLKTCYQWYHAEAVQLQPPSALQ